jgi:multidrug efflux pump subunit AcrA (membrane-fusion protein)
MRFLARSLVGLFMLSLTLALLGLAGGSLFSAMQTRLQAPERAGIARERVFAVRLVDLEPGSVTPVLETFGEVRSRRTMELRAPMAGRVIALAEGFADGAEVSAGQLLLRMDPADAQAARDLAEADLDRASLDLGDAERAVGLAAEDTAAAQAQADLRARALERQRDLAGRGVGTDAAIETAALALSSARQSIVSRRQAQAQAEARRDQAEAALARTRIQLSEAERRLAQTELRATFSGTLADVSVVTGGILGSNERIGQIIDPDALEVALRVSTAQFSRLVNEDGSLIETPVNVVLDVMGTEVFSTGRLTRVSASVGEAATGRLIYVSLDAPRGFRPGDFVALQGPEPALEGVARLPATALDPAGTVLVLGPDDRLVAASVELVRRQGDDVLVRAPALADAQVVAERGPNLGAGILVRPVVDTPQPLPGADATPAESAQRPASAPPRTGGDRAQTGRTLITLEPERRARLIAFVEADATMPEPARARVIAQLAAPEVPAQVVARIEARMGG